MLLANSKTITDDVTLTLPYASFGFFFLYVPKFTYATALWCCGLVALASSRGWRGWQLFILRNISLCQVIYCIFSFYFSLYNWRWMFSHPKHAFSSLNNELQKHRVVDQSHTSPFFSLFSVVRPTQIFAFSKKRKKLRRRQCSQWHVVSNNFYFNLKRKYHVLPYRFLVFFFPCPRLSLTTTSIFPSSIAAVNTLLATFHSTKNSGLNYRNFCMPNGTVFSTRPDWCRSIPTWEHFPPIVTRQNAEE